MLQVNIDCAKSQGIVKPMHAVNNGPSHKFASDQRISNLEAYKDAGIPYARNHDAAFYSTYGGMFPTKALSRWNFTCWIRNTIWNWYGKRLPPPRISPSI